MPFEPTNLRLLCALAGAFTLSSCVTTAATSPTTVLAHAGLPSGEHEEDMLTEDGIVTVNGSTNVTLHVIGGEPTTYQLRLSSLRKEGGKLLLLDTGEKIDVTGISRAEVTVPAPGRTVGLVLGIVGGSGVVALLFFLVALSQWKPYY